MTGFASGLYSGRVIHVRSRPRKHRLCYRIFQTLIDLDELPAMDGALRLFSHNRFNLIGFYDRDHGDGSGPLRPYVSRVLAEAGIDHDGGPIRLLCLPRVLGFVFNPISAYFCHRKDGALAAVLYEVNNTFGQRHSYLFPIDGTAGGLARHGCAKAFYVSPFMDMGMTYAFEVAPPAEDFRLVIRGSDAHGLLLSAAFSGQREALSDRTLLRAFLAHPLLTLKVVAGIHWEAAKMLAKGLRMTRRPGAPKTAVTVG